MNKSRFLLLFCCFFVVNIAVAQIETEKQKAFTDLNRRHSVYLKYKTPPIEIRKELKKAIYHRRFVADSTLAFADRMGFEIFLEYNIPFRVLPPLMLKAKYKRKSFSTDDWSEIPNYHQLLNFFAETEKKYPEQCSTVVIGQSVLGRDLVAMKISDNVQTNENEPEVMFTGSIHGNETVGMMALLRFADFLLTSYPDNQNAKSILENTEVWLIPLVNPDGLYQYNSLVIDTLTRVNAMGVDLNRNFPDPKGGFHPDGRPRQPETQAIIDFVEQRHFVLSVGLHTGAEVVNYPWDTWQKRHPEDMWFRFISREYADTAQYYSVPGYLDSFNNGITNGYDWYEVEGGLQDYMNYFKKCKEITLELSNFQQNNATMCNKYFEYNLPSLLNFTQQSHYGLHGTIADATTGNPLEAKIEIPGFDESGTEVFSNPVDGSFTRMLYTGKYNINLIHETDTIRIEDLTIENYKSRYVDVKFPLCGLYGVVIDKNTNLAVGNAKIEISDNSETYTISCKNGEYTLNANPGVYDMVVSAAGYDTLRMHYIHFYEKKFREYNINMGKTPAGIQKQPYSAEIKSYPNPFTDYAHIVLPDTHNTYLSVFDSNGRNVTHKFILHIISPYELNIDARKAPDGIYFIRTQTSRPYKIIKQTKR